jgi:UDP-N-acetylmuramoyl-L-alanyl-D-glutamate--2,6-diaminopimelate ligase
VSEWVIDADAHVTEPADVWAARVPLATLVVTASADATDELDRVQPEEERAFRSALERQGVRYEFEETLERAVGLALDRIGEGDLLLLMGAQGMDRGREFLRDPLGEPAPEA